MKQTIGIALVAAMFVAAGWLTAAQAAPPAVMWSTLGLLGVGAVVLLFVVRYRIGWPKSPAETASPRRKRAQDGRDRRVDVDEEKFSLTNLTTGETTTLAWRDVTGVYVVASDRSPTGDISYVIHEGARTLEIPLGAVGNERFLAAMQQRLAGFDDDALIEGMAMTRGSKQVWPAQTETSPPVAAAP